MNQPPFRPGSQEAATTTGEYHPEPPLATGEYHPEPLAATGEYHPADPRQTTDFLADETEKTPPGQRKTPALPERVAGYDILGVLGRGAYGVVYKARQPGLNRVVALKMVLAGSHADAHELARFRAEAEVIARLQHPNIVQIYEVGEDDGKPFFSLEFVDGGSLKEKMEGVPQPPRQAAETARTLALAMDHAHKNGIIHRDLKPANVLLTNDGVPKIGDFGLARQLEADSGRTRTGTVVGTPSYMAPEQAEGNSRDAGPLADVYALGAILYDLLTGRAPFRGSSVLETLEQVRKHEPVAPTQLQPGLPRDVETICLKCLHKDPARRYASAGDLAEDLRRYLAGEPIRARPVSRAERLVRWCRRNPWIAGLSAAAVLFVIGWGATASGLAWGLKVQKDETDRARVRADANAARAEEQATIADQNRVAAENAADQAKRKHRHAVDQMTRLAATLVNRMRKLRVSPEREPQLARLRTDSLEELRKGMLELAREMDEKGVSTFGGPATYQALGDLMMSLGQGEEALRLYRQAFDLLRKIADDPDARAEVHDVGQGNLGMMHLSMGDAILGLTGDARTALDLFRQARDLHQDLVAHARSRKYSELDKKRFLSHDNWFLAKAYLALGDPVAARDHLRQCLAYRQEWVAAQPRNPVAQGFLVQAHMGAGHVAGHLGDAAGVREHFGAAVRLMEDLGRRSPDSFDFKHDLADVYGAYGDAQMRLGLGDEAEKSYRRAFDNITAVAKHAPDDPAPLPLLALTHERLAALARSRGNAADAARHAEEACRLRRELAELEPNNLVRQAGYVLALARCGRPAEALPRADKLRPRVAGSPELLLQLARCYAAGGQQGREKALEAVRTATAKDYRDAAVLETDPELAELRGEPAFRDVVAAVKKRS